MIGSVVGEPAALEAQAEKISAVRNSKSARTLNRLPIVIFLFDLVHGFENPCKTNISKNHHEQRSVQDPVRAGRDNVPYDIEDQGKD